MNKRLHTSMVNMDVMYNVFGKDKKSMKGYLELFIKKTDILVREAEAAIQQKNSELALKYFHNIKGPIGSSGFSKMHQLCESAEEKIVLLEWVAASHLCHEIRHNLEKLKLEIRNLL